MTEDMNKRNPVEHEKTEQKDELDDLEYLRNRYLRGGNYRYSPGRTTYSPAGASVNPSTESETNGSSDELEALRARYLHPSHKQSTASKVEKTDFVCNIFLLCAVIVSGICAFVWFVTPTIRLGNTTYTGKTSNIFSFLFLGENSMIKTVKATADSISDVESNPLGIITSATHVFRVLVVGIVGIAVLIGTLARTALAVNYFIKHDSIKLRATTVQSIAEKFSVYICLAFFGSLSGGSNSEAYYHGYTAGVGMTIGLALATGCVIAVAVLTYVSRRKSATTAEKYQYFRSAIAGVGYLVTELMLAFMNLYGVLMYALTSAMQAMVYLKQYSFALTVILFPLLNIVVYFGCTAIHTRAAKGFNGAFLYLTTFDSTQLLNSVASNKIKQAQANFARSFAFVITVSAVALMATALLSTPAIGLGWSFDYHPYLIVIMAVSAIGQILLGFVGYLEQSTAKRTQPAAHPATN